jgi:hypothetical protein
MCPYPPSQDTHTRSLHPSCPHICIFLCVYVFEIMQVPFGMGINKPDAVLSFGVCDQDLHANLLNLVMHCTQETRILKTD